MILDRPQYLFGDTSNSSSGPWAEGEGSKFEEPNQALSMVS